MVCGRRVHVFEGAKRTKLVNCNCSPLTGRICFERIENEDGSRKTRIAQTAEPSIGSHPCPPYELCTAT